MAWSCPTWEISVQIETLQLTGTFESTECEKKNQCLRGYKATFGIRCSSVWKNVQNVHSRPAGSGSQLIWFYWIRTLIRPVTKYSLNSVLIFRFYKLLCQFLHRQWAVKYNLYKGSNKNNKCRQNFGTVNKLLVYQIPGNTFFEHYCYHAKKASKED